MNVVYFLHFSFSVSVYILHALCFEKNTPIAEENKFSLFLSLSVYSFVYLSVNLSNYLSIYVIIIRIHT